MKLEDLNEKERLIISEFLFAQQSGTLMASEGEDVIDLFKRKKIQQAYMTSLDEDSILILMLRKKSCKLISQVN